MSDPAVRQQVDALDQCGLVERVRLDPDDSSRRRGRLTTSAGVELAFALGRDQRLGDGAVLVLESERAVVVDMAEPECIVLCPVDLAAALVLGHRAGHLHWRVQFVGDALAVMVEPADRGGSVADVIERVADLIDTGRITVVE